LLMPALAMPSSISPWILLYHRYDKETQQKASCPVTNIITHCDGMWCLSIEIIHQRYHSYSSGYGKVSHSGYHFLDAVYQFIKAGWTDAKRPD
jgi:hypothetical protein